VQNVLEPAPEADGAMQPIGDEDSELTSMAELLDQVPVELGDEV
jgi:hypothetical protein